MINTIIFMVVSNTLKRIPKKMYLSQHRFGAYVKNMKTFSVFISHFRSLRLLSEKSKLISYAKCLPKSIVTPLDSLDPHNYSLSTVPCVFHSFFHRLISTPYSATPLNKYNHISLIQAN